MCPRFLDSVRDEDSNRLGAALEEDLDGASWV